MDVDPANAGSAQWAKRRQGTRGGQFTITLIGGTPRARIGSATRNVCPSDVTAYSSRMGDPRPSGSANKRRGAVAVNVRPGAISTDIIVPGGAM